MKKISFLLLFLGSMQLSAYQQFINSNITIENNSSTNYTATFTIDTALSPDSNITESPAGFTLGQPNVLPNHVTSFFMMQYSFYPLYQFSFLLAFSATYVQFNNRIVIQNGSTPVCAITYTAQLVSADSLSLSGHGGGSLPTGIVNLLATPLATTTGCEATVGPGGTYVSDANFAINITLSSN